MVVNDAAHDQKAYRNVILTLPNALLGRKNRKKVVKAIEYLSGKEKFDFTSAKRGEEMCF